MDENDHRRWHEPMNNSVANLVYNAKHSWNLTSFVFDVPNQTEKWEDASALLSMTHATYQNHNQWRYAVVCTSQPNKNPVTYYSSKPSGSVHPVDELQNILPTSDRNKLTLSGWYRKIDETFFAARDVMEIYLEKCYKTEFDHFGKRLTHLTNMNLLETADEAEEEDDDEHSVEDLVAELEELYDNYSLAKQNSKGINESICNSNLKVEQT